MTPQYDESVLEIDRADLLAILELRFGWMPPDVIRQVQEMTDGAAIERMILVAANVADWPAMQSELSQGNEAFRIVGESFNPISSSRKGNE